LRASEREARFRGVGEQRAQRKADMLMWKRADAEKAIQGRCMGAGAGQEAAPPGCLAGLQNLRGAWLAVIAMAGFAKIARDEQRFAKLDPAKQKDFIEEHFESIRAGTRRAGQLVEAAVRLKVNMDSVQFRTRKELIACMLQKKIRVRCARKDAACIATSLFQWRPARMFMLFKRIALRVRLLQSSWRMWQQKMATIRAQVSARWHLLEGEIARRQVREERRTARTRVALQEGVLVDCKRISEAVRLRFLTHELRARRHLLLPKLRVWEEECVRAEAAFRDHLYSQAAMRALGLLDDGEEGIEETQMFLFPPPQPSHIPTDADIQEMIERCGRRSDGWTPIPIHPGARWT